MTEKSYRVWMLSVILKHRVLQCNCMHLQTLKVKVCEHKQHGEVNIDHLNLSDGRDLSESGNSWTVNDPCFSFQLVLITTIFMPKSSPALNSFWWNQATEHNWFTFRQICTKKSRNIENLVAKLEVSRGLKLERQEKMCMLLSFDAKYKKQIPTVIWRKLSFFEISNVIQCQEAHQQHIDINP